MVKGEEVLEIQFSFNHETTTIRGYLKNLLTELWRQGESFSGKRPFGDSGWEYDLYLPLAKAGLVASTTTVYEDEYIETEIDDTETADKLIFKAIEAL